MSERLSALGVREPEFAGISEALGRTACASILWSDVLARLLSDKGAKFITEGPVRDLRAIWSLFFPESFDRVPIRPPHPDETLTPAERRRHTAALRAAAKSLRRLSKVADVPTRAPFGRFVDGRFLAYLAVEGRPLATTHRSAFGWGRVQLANQADELEGRAGAVSKAHLPARQPGHPARLAPEERAFVLAAARLARAAERRPRQGLIALAFWIRFKREVSRDILGDLVKPLLSR